MRSENTARGQSSGMIVFFLIIAISALLWGVLDPGFQQVTDSALNQTGDQQSEDQINQSQKIWNNLLFAPIALGLLFLIARSVFQSRGGR